MTFAKTLTDILLPIFTVLIILSGCSPNAIATTDNAESLLSMQTSESKKETPTLTPSHTVTLVPSSTPSLTPTITDTPTITPSPTPNMVMPGDYYVGRCTNTKAEYNTTYTLCVAGVRVASDRKMIFNMTWMLSNIPPDVSPTKRSDQGNKKMYLIDNLGNRYDHINGGGAAYSPRYMVNDYPVAGWFEFPTPPIGALRFDFHDDDYHIVIKDIVLIPGYGYIQYDTLQLDQYPLIVQYDEDKWDPTKSEENTNMLRHKTMSSCTIQPISPIEPIGKLKSLTAVGDINYKIHGYFDDDQDLYVREYVYESGIDGWDPGVKPFFYVTIPADTSLECIVAVNNVLARLAEPEQ